MYKDIKVREKAFLVIRSQSIRPKHEVHTEKCPGTKLERKVGRRSGRGPSAELGIGLALCNDGAEARTSVSSPASGDLVSKPTDRGSWPKKGLGNLC